VFCDARDSGQRQRVEQDNLDRADRAGEEVEDSPVWECLSPADILHAVKNTVAHPDFGAADQPSRDDTRQRRQADGPPRDAADLLHALTRGMIARVTFRATLRQIGGKIALQKVRFWRIRFSRWHSHLVCIFRPAARA